MPRRFRKRIRRNPGRKSYRRRYRRSAGYRKKQRWRRKYKRFQKSNTMRFNGTNVRGGIFGDKALVKFVYNDYGPWTWTNGALYGRQVYRGNSLYDPDYSGTGHQCKGYDQLVSSTLFTRYMVYASKIKLKYRIMGTVTVDGSEPIMLTLVPTTSTYGTITISDTYLGLLDFPHAKHRFGGVSALTAAQNGQTDIWQKCSNFMSTKRLEGGVLDQALYTAPYNNNPTNTWYWNIEFRAGTDTAAPAARYIQAYVQITYYALLMRGDFTYPS